MNYSIYEITVDLFTLTSTFIHPRTFYTVFLDIGSKQTQISSKKCSNVPKVLPINESLTIRTTLEELEECQSQGKLSIYRIQNYGVKFFFGEVPFTIQQQKGSILKLKVLSCEDNTAQLELRCQIKQLQMKVLSRNNSKNSHHSSHRQTSYISDDIESLTQLSLFSKKKFVRCGSVKNTKTKAVCYNPIQTERISHDNQVIREQKVGLKSKGSVELLHSKTQVNWKQPEPEADLLIQSDTVSENLNSDPEEDYQNSAYQIPNKITVIKQTERENSIGNNLQLIENYSFLLKKTQISQQLQEENDLNSKITKKSSKSKDEVEKVITNLHLNLKKVHMQEDILNDDEKIQNLIKNEERLKLHRPSSISTIKNTESRLKLKQKLSLQTHVHDLIYKNSKQPAILRVRSLIDEESPTSRRYHLSRMDSPRHSLQEQNKGQTDIYRIHNSGSSTERFIIKPNRIEGTISFEQQESDNYLTNMVQGIMKQAKDNLGYIKLSKLTYLRNQIKEMKDRNKHLMWVNESLIQNEKFMSKKIQIAEQIIKKKDEVLNRQFQQLKLKFQEVSQKLVKKYSTQMEKQQQIINLKKQLAKSQETIKNLKQKILLKDQQVQHYKLLLVADEDKKQEKVITEPGQSIKNEFISKKHYMERQCSKISLKQSFKGQFSKQKNIFSSSICKNNKKQTLISLSAQKTESVCEGIEPSFKDFFMTFINKPEQSSKTVEKSASTRRMKKGNNLSKMEQNFSSIQLIMEAGGLTQI